MLIKFLNRLVPTVSGKAALRTVLIVLFVLQIVGAVGLVGYLSYRNGQQAVNEVASELRSEVSDRVKQYLNTYLTNERLFTINKNHESFQRLNLVNSSNALISTTDKYLTKRFGTFTKINSNQQLAFINNGKREFVQIVPFRDEYSLDGLIVVVVPEADFMEQIHANTYTTILLCVATLVVTTGICILTTRWIIKPILNLNTTDKELAKGEGGKTVEIQRSDEVGQLANSFNSMAGQLQASFTELMALNEALAHSDLRLDAPHHAYANAAALRYRKFRGIFNHTFQFTGLLSSDGILLEANQTALNFGGLQREEVIGKLLWECYWWTISEETKTQLQSAIERAARGEFVRYEVDILGAGNRIVSTDFSLKPICDENGTVEFIISEGRDITERKQAQQILAEYNHTLETKVTERTAQLISINEQLKREIIERHQVEQALRESEERFREIAGTINQFFFVRSVSSGQFIYVSPSYEKIWGRTCESLYQNPKSWMETLYPDDRDLVLDSLTRQFQGNSLKREYRILRSDGSIRWIAAEISVVRDETGQPLRFVGLAEDVSDRKRVEAEIIRSKDLLEAIFHESADAIFLVNAETLLITDCNRRAIELFEAQSKDELLNIEGHTLQKESFTSGELHSLVDENLLYGFWSRELEYVTKKGNLFWGNLAAKEIYVAGQKMHLVRVTDITERKQSQLILQEREQFLRSIYEGIEAAVFIVDILEGGGFRYVGINPAHERMSGILSSEISGKTPEQVLNPEMAQIVSKRYQACLDAGETITSEEDLVIKGRETWWITSLTPVRDSNGEIYRLIGTCLNISDRKQAEEALRQSTQREQEKSQRLELTLRELKQTQSQLIQAEKMSSLGQMVAGIAHEINNPVSFIYGNLTPARHYFQDLLRLVAIYQKTYLNPTLEIQKITDEIDLDFLVEDWSKLMDSMQIGAERIREIVRNLRNFSRLDEQELKAVDIHEGIDNTLLILQHRLRADGIRPKIQLIKDYGQLPLVTCYASQLNQVFMNLLNNAIDALDNQPAPRVITIHTEMSSRYWSFSEEGKENEKTSSPTSSIVIRITDNGSGMDEVVRNKIFDPFFTTKSIGNGTGLGLSISYQIVVETHKGQISCISAPGQGTEFIVEIPVLQD